MHAVGHVRHRHFDLRPSRKQRLEDPPADLAVQPADAVDGAAAPNRQVGHVEWLGRIVAVSPSQRQQILERNRKFLLGILFEILLHQIGSETVKARLDRSVGGEKVSGARNRQRQIEWLLVIRHVGAGSFQHRERRMAFVEMANLRLQAEGPAGAASLQSPGPAPASDATPDRLRRVRW